MVFLIGVILIQMHIFIILIFIWVIILIFFEEGLLILLDLPQLIQDLPIFSLLFPFGVSQHIFHKHWLIKLFNFVCALCLSGILIGWRFIWLICMPCTRNAKVLNGLKVQWVLFICLYLLKGLLIDGFKQQNLPSRILDEVWRGSVQRVWIALVPISAKAQAILGVLGRLRMRLRLLLLQVCVILLLSSCVLLFVLLLRLLLFLKQCKNMRWLSQMPSSPYQSSAQRA